MSEIETNNFVTVPLPFQVPEPPDFSKVPLSVIHSATVETLISQTEDLSARLKVQIRRNAVLERRALELEENAKNQEQQLLNIKQQFEVLSEKDNSHNEKVRTLEATSSHQKEEIELLEIRYSEQTQLFRKELAESLNQKIKLEQEIADLSRLLPLEKENFKLADDNSFFKTKVEDLCKQMQIKENEARERNDHIQTLEATVQQQQTDILNLKQQLETQMIQIKKQTDSNSKMIETQSELENFLILKEREKEHAVSSLTSDLQTTRQELRQLHSSLQALQSEKINLESHLKSTEETLNNYSKDNSDLEKQIQNLQSLWYKLQSEFEKEKTKTTALTKLNRELSVELQRTKSSPQNDEDFFKRYVNNARNIDL